MKKLLTSIIILFFIGQVSYSQDWDFEKPDYSKIEKNIKDKKSNLYYESLMNRFSKADSTLSLNEKRHLYYGYTFQESYSPYGRSTYEDSLRNVLQEENLAHVDFEKIIAFGDKILRSNPFNLDALNYQLFAFEQTKDQEAFQKKLTQLRTIVDVLMSSGNGKTKEDAFYVIDTSHEYNLLSILGFQFGGSQHLIEHYDYLSVAENNQDIEGFYFDVTPCLNSILK